MHQFSKFFLAAYVIASVALTGCAGTPVYHPATTFSIPALNVEARAEVGETIISKANFTSVPAKRLLRVVTVGLLGSSFTLGPAILPLESEDKDGKYYRHPSIQTKSFLVNINRSEVVYVPNRKEMPASLAGPSLPGLTFSQDVFEDAVLEQFSTGSFKRQLIYGGLSQNVISISYREFVDNMARPAFTQDVKYDLGESKIIGFKGARFEVSKATNTELTYKVIKALD